MLNFSPKIRLDMLIKNMYSETRPVNKKLQYLLQQLIKYECAAYVTIS